MEAYTFRKNDAHRGIAKNPRGSVSTRRALSFNRKHITLSKRLSDELGVSVGSHIAFTYYEEKPDHIFIRAADEPGDTKDIQYTLCLERRDKAVLKCSASAVINHVLSQVGASRTCTCYVSPKPTLINGKNHYQILVSCPIKIN